MSASNNIFLNLYKGNTKNYISAGYVCDNNANAELKNSFGIDETGAFIKDADGNKLANISLVGVGAGGGVGIDAGSPTKGGGIFEYTSQTKILQPNTAYLIQGPDFGLAYEELYFKIFDKNLLVDYFDIYSDLSFDFQYVDNFNAKSVHISTNAYHDKNGVNDSFIDIINSLFCTLDIPVEVSLEEKELDADCAGFCSDDPSGLYLKFKSKQLGFNFTILNVKIDPIYQSDECPDSPFTLNQITVQDVINAIAQVQPTPYKVIIPKLHMNISRTKTKDDKIYYVNEKLEDDAYVNDSPEADDEYTEFDTLDMYVIDDDGNLIHKDDYNKKPKNKIYELGKLHENFTIKFKDIYELREFKEQLYEYHKNGEHDKEIELLKYYISREKFIDAANPVFGKLSEFSLLEEMKRDKYHKMIKPLRSASDVSIPEGISNYINDNSAQPGLYGASSEDDIWTYNEVEGVDFTEDDEANKLDQSSDTIYATKVARQNPDVYTIDCSMYAHIIGNIQEGLTNLGDINSDAYNFAEIYDVVIKDESQIPVGSGLQVGDTYQETITYNPTEIQKVYETISEITGIYDLSQGEKPQTFVLSPVSDGFGYDNTSINYSSSSLNPNTNNSFTQEQQTNNSFTQEQQSTTTSTKYKKGVVANLNVGAMKYPNGAMRGIVIAPVYPDGYIDMVKPLKINHIKDYIEYYNEVEHLSLRDFIEDHHHTIEDKLLKHLDVLTKNTFYQKFKFHVLCAHDSVEERTDAMLSMRCQELVSDMIKPSVEGSFVAPVSPYQSYEDIIRFTSEKEFHEIDDAMRGWTSAKKKHPKYKHDNYDDETEWVKPQYKKSPYKQPKNYVGMYGYLKYVNNNNLWTEFKTLYSVVGGPNDEHSNTMNMVPSFFIYNPNNIPIKINYLMFA